MAEGLSGDASSEASSSVNQSVEGDMGLSWTRSGEKILVAIVACGLFIAVLKSELEPAGIEATCGIDAAPLLASRSSLAVDRTSRPMPNAGARE